MNTILTFITVTAWVYFILISLSVVANEMSSNRRWQQTAYKKWVFPVWLLSLIWIITRFIS